MQGWGKEPVHGGHKVVEHLLDTPEVEEAVEATLARLPPLLLQLFGGHSLDEVSVESFEVADHPDLP